MGIEKRSVFILFSSRRIQCTVHVQASSHCSQYCGAFHIAPLPREKKKILWIRNSLRHWKQFSNLCIASLPTAVSCKKRPQTELCVPLEIRIPIAMTATAMRRHCSFKGLSQDEEWADCSKNLRASLFINTYQINLVSTGSFKTESTIACPACHFLFSLTSPLNLQHIITPSTFATPLKPSFFKAIHLYSLS